jgi:hypothetical protein
MLLAGSQDGDGLPLWQRHLPAWRQQPMLGLHPLECCYWSHAPLVV